MTLKEINHVVTRPGRTLDHPDVEIPVADDLSTVPGIPKRDKDVAFYTRNYPLETQAIEKAADREWTWTVYTGEMYEYRKHTYKSKKGWVKYEHAICLALEQDYWQTQTIPSMEAEFAHFGTYEDEGRLAIDLADYIRSLGYKAQIHSPNDNSAAYIPMFVEAGLGQLGANGQLLSPHFGSRSRIMIISTDALVTYDKPVDYGIHKFCEECQVCVNRCPGRALVKEKVWWRGAEKHKLMYDRCRPVMATYEGCGVCMLVCPVQRYGMPSVMEHYVETGEVLGKGTDNLEGFEIRGKGYFGPGELPSFSREFFEIPHGTKEEWLFEQFKNKLAEKGDSSTEEATEFAGQLSDILKENRGFDAGL